MLSFPAAIKVYLCTVACDMRRSFDGLSMMAEHIVRANPLSGHLFMYCNRRTDRLKIPTLETTAAVCYKPTAATRSSTLLADARNGTTVRHKSIDKG